MNCRDIEMQAIARYGVKHQIVKLFEEFSELQKELCKFLDGKNNRDAIAEETGDVLILLDQLILMFDMEDEVTESKRKKLERLLERM